MALAETLVDSFDDNKRDAALWGAYNEIEETEGQVIATSSLSTVRYSGYYSRANYDLTSSYCKVQVTDAGNQGLATWEVYALDLQKDSNNKLQIFIATGTVYTRKVVSSVSTNTSSVSYDPTVHKYFRIRESGGTTYWESSADDFVNTTVLHSEANPIAVTSLNLNIVAGTWGSGELQITEAKWDNFNYSPSDPSTEEVRKIAHNLQVAWKKFSTLGSQTFTIGISTIGGPDVIGINAGAIGSPSNYRYDDESDYVLGLAWERGYSMPTGGLVKGLAEAELDNTSGRYTPRYMGGSGEFSTSAYLPNRPLIINAGFEVDGADVTYPQFMGLTSRSAEIDSRRKRVKLQAGDWIEYFQHKKLDQSVMYTGYRTDQWLGYIFGSVLGMSTAQYELDMGINFIPFGYFPVGSNVSEIVHQLVEAENGHLYQDEEGVFRFENRQHWDTSPHNMVSQIIYTADVLEAASPNDDHIINVVEISSEVRAKQTTQLLFSLGSAVALPTGADTSIWINFDDPILQIITPDIWQAFINSDGTGTNITSSVYLKSIDKFAQAAKLTFHNNYAQDGYLTSLTIYGRPAKVAYKIDWRSQDDSSVTAFDEKKFALDNNFIQNESWANSYAQMILDDYSDPENLQRITIRAKPNLRLGDLISWQGRHWRVFDMKTTLSPHEGFVQELLLLQREAISYFRIGISIIGGTDRIAP